jgi:hypothetical protein
MYFSRGERFLDREGRSWLHLKKSLRGRKSILLLAGATSLPFLLHARCALLGQLLGDIFTSFIGSHLFGIPFLAHLLSWDPAGQLIISVQMNLGSQVVSK